MTVLGAVFLPQLPPERLPDVARAADAAGLEELWLWEDCFREGGIASVTAALAATSRLRVGIGVVPAPLRAVTLLAMEVATVERMFPGRLVLGVGHGVQSWMAQVGVRPASPMTQLREYATTLVALLHGEQVTTAGRYVRLDGVRLDWPPEAPPDLHLAATGPRTLELAGELAGGTLLTCGTTPDGVREARQHVDVGRARAGRDDPHEVSVNVMAATGDGGAARLAAALEDWGLEASAGVAGDAAAVAEGVARWAEAGADRVVLQPTEDDPDPEEFVRFVAQDVRALVPG